MQTYYVQALIGRDHVGLYVEAPDFDSAWDAAEERIAQSYKGPFIIQALQLIGDTEPVIESRPNNPIHNPTTDT